MIHLYTSNNEDELFPPTKRQLTVSDLTPIQGITKENAEILLKMACKLMLAHKYTVFTDEEIIHLVMDTWPKFHVDKIHYLIKVFRQVESLKTVWFLDNNVIVDQKPANDLKSQLNELKEHLEIVMEIVQDLEKLV